MSNCTQKLRIYGTLIARILMGGFFLLAGVGKIMGGVDGTAKAIMEAGLPVATLLAWIVVVIEIVCGAAIIVGKKASKAALVLVIFVILANVLIHNISLSDGMFMKNLGLIAGLLYIAAYGPGDGWSLAKPSSSSMPSDSSGGM